MTLTTCGRISRVTATLERLLESSQHCIEELEPAQNSIANTFTDQQSGLLSELTILLEELNVATEEILAQNEELQEARHALEYERQRFQELFEFAPDGYLVTTVQGVIQDANGAAEKLLKLNRAGMINKPFIVFVSEADRIRFHTQLNRLASSQCLTDWDLNLKPRGRSPFPASISISAIFDYEGTWVGLRWLIRDISDRKQAKKLRHDAFHDSLTGLANRALLLDRLGHLLERHQRHPKQLFALLFLDLDRFKMINDSLGHLTGDQVLMEMASRLQPCVRRVDTLARLGGDEFVILLEDLHNQREAENCAARIQSALAEPFLLNDQALVLQASIGIVLSHPRYKHPTELLRDADLAMYRAKQQGGAGHQVFTEQMHTSTLNVFQLEQELHQALQRQEFEVYYQPIVSLSTQKLKGFEALVRWRHPHQGIMSPSDFLPIAEDSGLMVALDLWVLRSACQQMVQWQTEFTLTFPFMVSVNLSSRLFAQPNLVAQVQSILQDTGLDPRCLTLEITEGVIMINIAQSTETLFQLRALEVQLTIDDFGTGYSSLSRLQRLPFDGLKIDRTFLSESEGIEMVRAIIVLAHTLGLYVIAEGVETETQVQKLSEMECEFVQGYYFGRPESSQLAKLNISLKDG